MFLSSSATVFVFFPSIFNTLLVSLAFISHQHSLDNVLLLHDHCVPLVFILSKHGLCLFLVFIGFMFFFGSSFLNLKCMFSARVFFFPSSELGCFTNLCLLSAPCSVVFSFFYSVFLHMPFSFFPPRCLVFFLLKAVFFYPLLFALFNKYLSFFPSFQDRCVFFPAAFQDRLWIHSNIDHDEVFTEDE